MGTPAPILSGDESAKEALLHVDSRCNSWECAKRGRCSASHHVAILSFV